MDEFTVGPFRFLITEPYPVWVHIWYENERITMVRHDELRFLEFAIQRAINQAALKLKENAREME